MTPWWLGQALDAAGGSPVNPSHGEARRDPPTPRALSEVVVIVQVQLAHRVVIAGFAAVLCRANKCSAVARGHDGQQGVGD